ncbi:hypothetical protein [Undibacterium umbellatum]|uniref:Uncharacterized protein n=1 Tax=Undibacterium umbellatum TaxID=2762300 RepID=A0ABR6ZD62_9BURK|nr:hypothetical protein [Undibacterium umbellatum]MBC3909695.1 hypothetical protein [Undibacterium umbellatum]
MIPVTLYEIPYFSCDVAPIVQVLSASDLAQSVKRLKDGKQLVRCLTRRKAFVSNQAVVIPGKACVFEAMSINWETVPGILWIARSESMQHASTARGSVR